MQQPTCHGTHGVIARQAAIISYKVCAMYSAKSGHILYLFHALSLRSFELLNIFEWNLEG